MTRLAAILTFAVAVLTMVSLAVGGGPQGYSKEETTQMQNLMISKYIIDFEQKRQQISDKKVQEAMSDMKLLIIQRWITKLQPDMGLLNDIMPLNGKTTLNEVNEFVVNDLKERNTRSPLEEAMNIYTTNVEHDIQEHFTKQVSLLTVERDKLFDQFHDENETGDKTNIEKELNLKKEKLKIATFNSRFHGLAKTMAVQAYNFIFDKHIPS